MRVKENVRKLSKCPDLMETVVWFNPHLSVINFAWTNPAIAIFVGKFSIDHYIKIHIYSYEFRTRIFVRTARLCQKLLEKVTQIS